MKSQLSQEIASEKMVLYGKSFCPHTKKSRDLLSLGNIAYKNYDIDLMPNGDDIQASLLEISG